MLFYVKKSHITKCQMLKILPTIKCVVFNKLAKFVFR